MVKDPNKRLSLKEVLNHNWIIKNKPKWPKIFTNEQMNEKKKRRQITSRVDTKKIVMKQ